MIIELDLTESQWCELANAVSSKAHSVENGDYDHEGECDNEEWAKELQATYDIVAKALEEKGVAY